VRERYIDIKFTSDKRLVALLTVIFDKLSVLVVELKGLLQARLGIS
jgi:hypothetical protein